MIYVGVAAVVKPVGEERDPGVLFPALLSVAAATGVGTVIHGRLALAGPIQSGRLDPAEGKGQERAFRSFMINLVLSESVGIHGLVLSIRSGVVWYSLGFAAAAIALLYIHRPTARDLVARSSSSQRGEDPTPIS